MNDIELCKRLRDFAAMDDWPFIAEAADEIERLRAEIAEANAYMAEASYAIEKLTAERDALEKHVDELIDEKYAPRGAFGDSL